ncbi:MAG TPA: T9SS type A sorting domain-containing protein, partial [Bacteroidales bacterium]|nr:T9SS type A sorting domain-containing protein [Bacteroidales bacterium]
SNNLNQFDELNLYDLNGQLVYTNKIESENSMSIDVSLFRKGVYTLQIVSTKTLYHEKLIIQ